MKKLLTVILALLTLSIFSACEDTPTECQHNIVTDSAIAATCTETGITEGSHCSLCNEVIVAQEIINAHGHIEEIVLGYDSTCTNDGLTDGKKCSICGFVTVEQIAISATGHNETIDAAIIPTCTSMGLTEGSHCSVCGETLIKQTNISPKGHNLVIDEGVAATCINTGLSEGSHCKTCQQVLKEQNIIPITQHNAPYGVCETCNTITNAYEAIIYYVCTYGIYSDDAYYYYDNLSTETADAQYCIVYDSNTAQTIFTMNYTSSTMESFIMCDFVYGSTMQTIAAKFEISGTTLYGEGEIYTSTFRKSVPYIYSWSCNSTSLSSSIKNLFTKETVALLSGVNAMLKDFNSELSLESIGFTSYQS